MNIKDLTKNYLNTLSGLSENEKEKIASFNADSDWVVFSAVSTSPVDIGVTENNDPDWGLFRFSTDYGGFIKVDLDGYVLVDESEYNPFYPLPNLNKTRKSPLDRRTLGKIRDSRGRIIGEHRRDTNGFLRRKENGKIYSNADKVKGEEDGWERFQHTCTKNNIPIGIDEGTKTTRNSVDIKSEPLSSLLEEVWNEVVGNEDGHDVGRLTFPYGAGLINTPSYLNQTRYWKS